MTIGAPVIGGDPRSILYISNIGVLTQDPLAIRDSATKEFQLSRTFDVSNTVYTVDTQPILVVQSASGPFTDGETILNTTDGTSTAVVFHYASGVFILTTVVGTFNASDVVQGQTSLETASVDQYLYLAFTIGQQFVVFDPSVGSPVGSGTVISVTGFSYDFVLSSGTAAVNNVLIANDDSAFGGIVNLSSASVPTVWDAGIFSYLDLLGSGFNGTAIVQKNSIGDAILAGVIDASGFGGSPTSFLISANRQDGSSAIIAFSDLGAYINPVDPSGNGSVFTVNTNQVALLTTANGGDDIGFFAEQGNGERVGYRINGTNYYFPKTVPSVNDVMSVSSVVGIDVTLQYSAGGGGGGSPGGSQYSIQMNDGSGNFAGNSSFQWNYTSDTPLFLGSNGLAINIPTSFFKIGESTQTDILNYQEMSSGAWEYYNHENSFSSTNFTSIGPSPHTNDFNKNTSSYSGGLTPHTWTITIDGTNGFSGVTYTPAGVNSDALTLGPVSYSGPNDSYTVTIDSATGVEAGQFFFGSGLDDAIFTGTFSSPVPNQGLYEVMIDSVGATDTFRWSVNGIIILGGVPIVAGVPYFLSDGISVTFAASTGHNLNNSWTSLYGCGAAAYYMGAVTGTPTENTVYTGSVSGSTGLLKKYEPGANVAYFVSLSGPLKTGDAMDDGFGNTIVIVSTIYMVDTFSYSSMAGSDTNYPCYTDGGPCLSIDGMSFQFSPFQGNDIGNQWTFSFTRSDARVYNVSGLSGTVLDYDTITTTSGGVAQINRVDLLSGTAKAYLINITNDSFINGETATASSGGTFTVGAFDSYSDTYSKDATGIFPSLTQIPIASTSAFDIGYGVQGSFMTVVGHSLGDNWSFTNSAVSSKKLNVGIGQISIGDLSNVYGGSDRFFLDLANGSGSINVSNSFNVVNSTTNNSLFSVVTGNQRYVVLGEDGLFAAKLSVADSLFIVKDTFANNFLRIDVGQGIYALGDEAGATSGGAFLTINNDSTYPSIVAKLKNKSVLQFLEQSRTYIIGDVDNNNNGTKISIDENSSTTLLKANNGITINDYRLPLSDGSAGQIMTRTTTGIAEWADPSIETVKISLSNADLLSLNSVAVVAVNASGSTIIQVLGAMIRVNGATTAFTSNFTISLRQAVTGAMWENTTALGNVSTSTGIEQFNQAAVSPTMVDGTNLEIWAPLGNPVGGDTTADVYVTYRKILV